MEGSKQNAHATLNFIKGSLCLAALGLGCCVQAFHCGGFSYS